ncbi:MAG: hypothetical protein IK122_00385 [Alphaproteobacteria bacterium]|nr:hypothetical protein [Alphaproteobacteria bacterium]
MDKNKQKSQTSCWLETGSHTVNIFHIHTFYRFLKICCPCCSLQSQCTKEKHKREACVVASEAERLLGKFVFGRVSSFASDDFYLDSKSHQRQLHSIFCRLEKKYKTK